MSFEYSGIAHARKAPPGRADDELAACLTCERVYWRGSHYQRMRGKLESWQRGTGKITAAG
ncbi:MAG: hypothetical protein KGZ83_12290 [Sulfuricella sp.]|nr:hypothetical protein [Sulfuricella sp.]